jgi:threonine synthase
VKYVSTRGSAPVLGFEDVLLTGLARDGGLYVPQTWPQLTPERIAALAGRPYHEAAFDVMAPYVDGAVPDGEMRALLEAAYASFSHPAVAPLVQIAPNDWVLELFHGPTLAFKDVAMQVLSRLMDRSLKKRGARATIVGATSGDTGGAAIEAFRGRDAIDIFILFPKGRVSDVQRRQMTTPSEANVHAIAIEGTFDDCQNAVKALFNDLSLRDRLHLAGVNSINWARIMAQIVYYFTSAVALGAPRRKVSFSVPTGNFGDIFAGYVASRMGLPIERLIIATNANDILARTCLTGRYETKAVVPTSSPSMDIQISSNFERLLFELSGRDPGRVRTLMGGLAQSGTFTLEPQERAGLTATFKADRVDEAETVAAIQRVRSETGYVAEPHTVTGIEAARRLRASESANPTPVIALATAHPAKFPDALRQALGQPPAEPARVAAQRAAPERMTVLPNDLTAITDFISTRTRATRATA